MRCHNGPLLTNEGFHNIGTGPAPGGEGPFDYGRGFGLQAALFNPFACQGSFSDHTGCEHVTFAQKQAQEGSVHGAFKVPSLRNVAATAPYLHDGRHDSLGAVLEWYRNPPSKADSGHELPVVSWSDADVAALEAFLGTLTALPGTSAGP